MVEICKLEIDFVGDSSLEFALSGWEFKSFSIFFPEGTRPHSSYDDGTVRCFVG